MRRLVWELVRSMETSKMSADQADSEAAGYPKNLEEEEEFDPYFDDIDIALLFKRDDTTMKAMQAVEATRM